MRLLMTSCFTGQAFAAGVVDQWEAAAGVTATEAHFEPFTFGLRDHFKANEGKMPAGIMRLIGFAKTYRETIADYDLILSPVLTTPPPEIGYLDTSVQYDTAIERLVSYAQFTSIGNVAGAPSISLPLGMSSTGLPIGALFNAKHGAERMLLELAYELGRSGAVD